MTYVVGVGGPIGAGKSRAADGIAVVYRGARRSFGGVVRRRAVASGRSTDRESLQEIGDEIIVEEGWNSFCRETLDAPADVDSVVVIDGIRHESAIDALRAIVGQQHLRVVFVDAPRAERLARLVARDGITEHDFDLAEAHPNERELSLVRDRADVVIDNTGASDEEMAAVVREVVRQLEESGFSARRVR